MITKENNPQNQGSRQFSVLFDQGTALYILKLTPCISKSSTSFIYISRSHEFVCVSYANKKITEEQLLLSCDPHNQEGIWEPGGDRQSWRLHFGLI
jgi:hypothetical protein